MGIYGSADTRKGTMTCSLVSGGGSPPPNDTPAVRNIAVNVRHHLPLKITCCMAPCDSVRRRSIFDRRFTSTGLVRQGAPRSWRSDGTAPSARSRTCRKPTANWQPKGCERGDGGQLPRPLEVGGAVPQTALIPAVTGRYSSALSNFALYSPKIADATENAVLRAYRGPYCRHPSSTERFAVSPGDCRWFVTYGGGQRRQRLHCSGSPRRWIRSSARRAW